MGRCGLNGSDAQRPIAENRWRRFLHFTLAVAACAGGVVRTCYRFTRRALGDSKTRIAAAACAPRVGSTLFHLPRREMPTPPPHMDRPPVRGGVGSDYPRYQPREVAGIIGIPGRLQSVRAAGFTRNLGPISSECALRVELRHDVTAGIAPLIASRVIPSFSCLSSSAR
jgi:hypothetical protein